MSGNMSGIQVADVSEALIEIFDLLTATGVRNKDADRDIFRGRAHRVIAFIIQEVRKR